jgi:Transposase DDE domain
VAAGLAFPHAAQAIQIVRRRKLPGKKKWSRETCYAITSLTTQASPAELATIIRGHWLIEDPLHWVRDLDFDEDRSQVRTASGPRVMATLRNLAITILRLAGHASTPPCATTPVAGPAPANDHELLNDFAGALLGGADRTRPADLDSAGRPRASMGACRSRTNADDRLPADPLGRIEGRNGIVEGRDVADVRPQSCVPHPLDDLT